MAGVIRSYCFLALMVQLCNEVIGKQLTLSNQGKPSLQVVKDAFAEILLRLSGLLLHFRHSLEGYLTGILKEQKVISTYR